MRVVIIREDNSVTIDGRTAIVDCSSMLALYHAVQWYGSDGVIETTVGDDIRITSLDTFQALINAALDVFAQQDIPPTLADLKANKIGALLTHMTNLRNTVGIEYPQGSGKRLMLSTDDMADISAAALQAFMARSGVGTWPADYFWIMANRQIHALPTANDMLALGGAAMNALTLLKRRGLTKAQEILALTTPAEVEAYDVTAGWS